MLRFDLIEKNSCIIEKNQDAGNYMYTFLKKIAKKVLQYIYLPYNPVNIKGKQEYVIICGVKETLKNSNIVLFENRSVHTHKHIKILHYAFINEK